MKRSVPLTEARAFIEAHFDEPVTLAQLAELSALSVSRFATAFRQQFGSSPYRYLCGLRIQRAQALLLAGVPGSVVAAEVVANLVALLPARRAGRISPTTALRTE